jgi:hypothetical protein
MLNSRFGIFYVLVFIFVEGLLAPLTRWGNYVVDAVLLWRTPLYLIPAWFAVAMVIASVVRMLQLKVTGRVYVHMAAVFVFMFLCALLGEAAGVWFDLWNFHGSSHVLLGVPLWIPLSYAAAFAFYPVIYKVPFAGGIQALLVGGFWLIVHHYLG